jgi:pimeloyl-ACP methyl ester carboxylesterase
MTTTDPFGELRRIRTATLEVGYYDLGDPSSPAALLLHGYPYDVHSYVDAAGELASTGLRVIVPYLRGHGPTTFLDPEEPRSGQQAALATDVIELMDALDLPDAVLAGYDWGGRAACIAAATWPERVRGLVSVNGYLIQDIAASARPLPAALEAGFWYFFYFLTERGRAGLAADPRVVAEVIWRRNSPLWAFTDAELSRVAESFANPDYVEVVLHSYRHRLGYAEGADRYAELEAFLAGRPTIPVPTITLDGTADGNFPATDGTAGAAHFTGPREHRQVEGAGHNLPRERPEEFVRAVVDVGARQRVSLTVAAAEM